MGNRVHRPNRDPEYSRGVYLEFLSGTSQCDDGDMEILQPLTHFSPIELKMLMLYYRAALCSECGSLTLDGCKRLLFKLKMLDSKFVVTPDHELLVKIAFNAMDTANDGRVSFAEFAKAMSAAIHGTLEEKARLSFRLYDTNRDNVIDQVDLKDFIRLMLKLGALATEMKIHSCCLTRGDAEQEELCKLKEMCRTGAEDECKIPYSSECASLYNYMLPQNELLGQNTESSSTDAVTSETSSSRPSLDSTFSGFDEAMEDTTINYSEEDLDRLVCSFFRGQSQLTFQDYIQRCKYDKYLLDGLGAFDFIFRSIFKPFEEFLSTPDRNEKIGQLWCNGKIRRVEIRGGLMYHYKPINNHLKLIIRIMDITEIRSAGNQIDFSVKIRKRLMRYKVLDPTGTFPVLNWLLAIVIHKVETFDNRHNSFAPVRKCGFIPLVDGQDTYRAMASVMRKATQQIFIAGWCVNPFIYMVRDAPDPSEYRLDNILETVAQRGVHVYIIIWHELSLAGLGLGTNQVQKYLSDLHPNVHCILHPHGKIFQWTHHQKIVVVDQFVAFIGGLDIGFGRFDTGCHTISDNNRLATMWPGEDYCNDTLPRVHITLSGAMKYKSQALRDGALDRDLFPRMPWHDVHCLVFGDVAKDISSNFITRWNHHKKGSEAETDLVNNITLELDLRMTRRAEDYLEFSYHSIHHTVKAQVVRSISTWSGSLRTERSIETAYVDLIMNSKHYVYIENQYFMSHTDKSKKIENKVAQAIIDRVSQAITNKETFRVMIFLPMHHSGDIYDPSTHQVMKWQRKTIQGVYEALHTNFPSVSLTKYLSFFCLANYGYINKIPHFSQVYIHSKLLISDDKYAIIGSANINDRSLVGNHDSEIALVIEDTDSAQTMFHGRLYRTGRSLKALRKRLFREHLGIRKIMERPQPSEERVSGWEFLTSQTLAAFQDPTSDHSHHFMRKRATDNTEIYQRVFPHFPCKRHRTVNDYKKDLDNYLISLKTRRVLSTAEIQRTLSGIHGYIVNYPLDWLSGDSLSKDTRLRIVDDNVFF